MYFQNFPKIYYDFDTTDNDRSLKILTDITANVRVRKQILEKITQYEEYDIQEGETPELIAEKFYGNPEYHWIIMLLNERYDYVSDYPINQDELEDYIASVYGAENIYDIHHYEKSGLVVEAKAILKVPSSTVLPNNLFQQNDYLLGDTSVARVDSINVAERELSISIQKGTFKYNDFIGVFGFRENTEKQIIEYTTVTTFLIPQNALTINETYNPITNYDYEIRENEKKRRIKLLAPELLGQIVQELELLMRQ